MNVFEQSLGEDKDRNHLDHFSSSPRTNIKENGTSQKQGNLKSPISNFKVRFQMENAFIAQVNLLKHFLTRLLIFLQVPIMKQFNFRSFLRTSCLPTSDRHVHTFFFLSHI